MQRQFGVAMAVWIGLILAGCDGPARAQAGAWSQAPPVPKPFEVAAIKPNRSGSNNTSMGTSHGRLTASNVTVRTLLLKAFRLTEVQLSGDPIGSRRSDSTSPPGPPTNRSATMIFGCRFSLS